MASLDELKHAAARGDQLDFLFFWGHQQSKGRATIGPECLSQWYPAPITLQGLTFPTAEHLMMFRKAWLFHDEESAQRVLAAPGPSEAKAIGRTVKGFDDRVWVENRSRIVADGNIAKFSQHPQLKEFLLGTGSKVLVEASPYDRIWGIGMAAADPNSRDPRQWRGQNLLGFALMNARTCLRATFEVDYPEPA